MNTIAVLSKLVVYLIVSILVIAGVPLWRQRWAGDSLG